MNNTVLCILQRGVSGRRTYKMASEIFRISAVCNQYQPEEKPAVWAVLLFKAALYLMALTGEAFKLLCV